MYTQNNNNNNPMNDLYNNNIWEIIEFNDNLII